MIRTIIGLLGLFAISSCNATGTAFVTGAHVQPAIVAVTAHPGATPAGGKSSGSSGGHSRSIVSH